MNIGYAAAASGSSKVGGNASSIGSSRPVNEPMDVGRHLQNIADRVTMLADMAAARGHTVSANADRILGQIGMEASGEDACADTSFSEFDDLNRRLDRLERQVRFLADQAERFEFI